MDVNMADAPHADHVNQADQPEQPNEIPRAGPNDMYDGEIKSYDSCTLVIVNATEQEDVFMHRLGESPHEHSCHLIEITFRQTTDFHIVKIYIPPEATVHDVKRKINAVLANKTEKDAIFWHYHGAAGGEDRRYRWLSINAYNFIDRLCKSPPDSKILLDSYIQTKWKDMWKLCTCNVEIVTLKSKLQDGAGRLINARDSYLTEGICRNFRTYLDVIWGEDLFGVAKRHPRSIPHIMGRDYILKSKSVRIWFSRRGKHIRDPLLSRE